jgi:hypothetical protein
MYGGGGSYTKSNGTKTSSKKSMGKTQARKQALLKNVELERGLDGVILLSFSGSNHTYKKS